MPIRAENRVRYPDNWQEIARDRKSRANWRCEWCGAAHQELGGRSPGGKWHRAIPAGEKLLRIEWPRPGDYAMCAGYDQPLRIVRIVLTVAHLDHQPENCEPENLRALCQQCHNRYDARTRRDGIEQRKRAAKALGDLFNE